MRTGWAALALVFSLSGCSSSTVNEASKCASRSGNYLAHFVEHPGGTCGPITDSIAAAGEHPPGCQGKDTPSADNCSVTVNQTCPAPGGGTFDETGTSHWSEDGSKGTAVFTVTSKPTTGAGCTSTYDVTFSKA